MNRHLAALLAAPLLAVLSAPVSARDNYVYGPQPDWSRYKALGEAALRAKLPDPDNWAIEWPFGYMPERWRHKGSFHGYLSCGRLRATGPVTGRNPVVNFVVVIDHDAVQTVDISSRDSNSLVNVLCADFISRGLLPPAQLMETASPQTTPQAGVIPALGLTIRTMPEGAYVATVDPGSAAQRAGLVAGTVVTHVNGIALGGMGEAMISVLRSDAATFSLATATGAHIELWRDQR